MYRQRSNYWCNTAFADRLRRLFGIPVKPGAASAQGWKEWKKASKEASRFGHWVTEYLLVNLQDIVMYPLDIYQEAKYKLKLRYKYRYHLINTGLGEMKYHSVADRALYGMFSLLVEFVEIEIGNGDVKDALRHLNWEASLTNDQPFSSAVTINDGKPSKQALVAAEVLILYYWWKNVRPARLSPYDVYPNDSIDLEADDLFEREITEEERNRLDLIVQLEHEYDDEDEEMLVRLSRISKFLWS